MMGIMADRWRWILAMGFSALVLLSGLVLVYMGGADYRLLAWFLVVIGGLMVAVNAVMRDRMM